MTIELRRALLSLALAMMAGFTIVGAAKSAEACVSAQCTDCGVPGTDCTDAIGMDCAIACAAVMPRASDSSIVIPKSVDFAARILKSLAATHFGPEPPPPRSG